MADNVQHEFNLFPAFDVKYTSKGDQSVVLERVKEEHGVGYKPLNFEVSVPELNKVFHTAWADFRDGLDTLGRGLSEEIAAEIVLKRLKEDENFPYRNKSLRIVKLQGTYKLEPAGSETQVKGEFSGLAKIVIAD